MEFILNLDQSLFQWINQIAVSSWADVFFPWITDLHKTIWFQGLVYPLLFILFVYKFQKKGIIVFLMGVLCVGFSDLAGNHLFKKNIERPRPFTVSKLNTIQRTNAHGYSFVSNHSTNMFAFATYTSRMIPSATIPTFLIASIVAYSRVYNGVHYPSDVIVGALMGSLWGFLFSWISIKFLKRPL